MSNPFTMKVWSPYIAGAGIGVLSWFAFATADKHLAITSQFEHAAALTQQAVVPPAELRNDYYAVRTAQGKSPKVSWEMTFLGGVFAGALLSAWLSRDRSDVKVPPLWRWRFGGSVSKRFVGAFFGAAIMIFGARMAGGCTSGHGISGTLQLAVSSWTFIVLAFATAVAVALLLFGKEGRRHV